jgi:hypothetical protein
MEPNNCIFISLSSVDINIGDTEEDITYDISKFISDNFKLEDISNIINDTIYISFSPVIKHKEITNTIANFLSNNVIFNIIRRYYNNIIIQNIDTAISYSVNNYKNISYNNKECYDLIDGLILNHFYEHKVLVNDTYEIIETAYEAVTNHINNKLNTQVKNRFQDVLSQYIKSYINNNKLTRVNNYKNKGIYKAIACNICDHHGINGILKLIIENIAQLVEDSLSAKEDYIYENIDFYEDEIYTIINQYLDYQT